MEQWYHKVNEIFLSCWKPKEHKSKELKGIQNDSLNSQ